MTTLTIRIPTEATEKLAGFIKSLGGEVVSAELTKEELSEKTLQELNQGLNEAFDIIEGKTERKSLMESLRG